MTIAQDTSIDAQTFSIPFRELTIDAADIIAILGYESENAPDHIREDLDTILNTAGDYCTIRGGIRLFDNIEISHEKRHILLQDVEFAAGKIITSQLRGADSAALFACTVGNGLENWSRALMADGDFLKGYIVDAIASVTVEAAVEKSTDQIPGFMPGKKMSNRYSPGYCGWDVAEQQKLFSLLPPNFCGITLSASSLMAPIKSVSGLIGLGPEMKKVDYTCRFCDLKDCVYRRQRENSTQD